LTVLGVVRDSSVTAPGQGNLQTGGVVMHVEAMRELVGEADALSSIAVSITGGVRDTLDRSDAVQDRLEAYLEAHPESGAEVSLTKQELVAIGELAGSFFVTFFLIFGLFSIAAGILLIFLIFVMLAAERRAEMGMARAIGMNRLHLTEAFVAEGMAYNLGSALVGALLGVGVAWVLISSLSRIFSEFGLTITFHVNPVGLVIAYAAGVVVTFATVTFASWRAANLNIVRAIRDIPEPPAIRSQTASLRELALGGVAALWYLAWVALVALWSVAGFALFTFSLTFYGLPFLAAVPVVALYVFGARSVRRGWGATHGWWRRALFVAWWILFNLVAVLTWFLFRTRRWAGRHRSIGGWALVMLVTGLVFVYLGGWVWGQGFSYLGGTTLAIFAVAMLSVYFGAPGRPAFTIAGVAALWYWLLPLPFSLLSDAGRGWDDPVGGLVRVLGLPQHRETSASIEMFFVSGIAMTAAGTLLAVFNASALLAVVAALGRMLGGIAPAVRTAIAYPLAARVRTGMTIAMFGLVVFSLVVMSFLNFNFTQLFLGEEARAGFDVRAIGNRDNRIPDLRAALGESDAALLEAIEGIGTVVSAVPLVSEPGATTNAERRVAPLLGGDAEFYELARLPLAFRAEGYADDAEVFEAIQRDPSLVVVSQDLLDAQGDPVEEDPSMASGFRLSVSAADLERGPWQPIPVVLRDRETRAEREVRVIGVLEGQVTGVLFELMGIYSTREAVAELSDGGSRELFFVTTAEGSEEAAKRVARGVESALLERGVQSDAIQEIIDDQTRQSTAFQLLFQGFMGLGLIVGIAALGVIAFRTVVERRQQIGMLRAIGYTRRLVGLSFFLESSFIALTGIAMGVLLGGGLSYNLLSNPENIGVPGVEIDFQVPWVHVLVIAGIAYLASALMTLIPARSASRVPVAEALRYE
jgi:ABC-type antimicrobial peptide transport system permease subunit